MKTTTPPPAAAPAPAVAPEVKEVKVEQAEAKPEKAEVKPTPALAQFQSLLASGDGAQAQAPKTETATDKPLLQQFMQWNQKTTQSDKGQ